MDIYRNIINYNSEATEAGSAAVSTVEEPADEFAGATVFRNGNDLGTIEVSEEEESSTA